MSDDIELLANQWGVIRRCIDDFGQSAAGLDEAGAVLGAALKRRAEAREALCCSFDAAHGDPRLIEIIGNACNHDSQLVKEILARHLGEDERDWLGLRDEAQRVEHGGGVAAKDHHRHLAELRQLAERGSR